MQIILYLNYFRIFISNLFSCRNNNYLDRFQAFPSDLFFLLQTEAQTHVISFLIIKFVSNFKLYQYTYIDFLDCNIYCVCMCVC